MTTQDFVDSILMLRRFLSSEVALAEKTMELSTSDYMKAHSEGVRDALSMVYGYTSAMLDNLGEVDA